MNISISAIYTLFDWTIVILQSIILSFKQTHAGCHWLSLPCKAITLNANPRWCPCEQETLTMVSCRGQMAEIWKRTHVNKMELTWDLFLDPPKISSSYCHCFFHTLCSSICPSTYLHNLLHMHTFIHQVTFCIMLSLLHIAIELLCLHSLLSVSFCCVWCSVFVLFCFFFLQFCVLHFM